MSSMGLNPNDDFDNLDDIMVLLPRIVLGVVLAVLIFSIIKMMN